MFPHSDGKLTQLLNFMKMSWGTLEKLPFVLTDYFHVLMSSQVVTG